VFAIFFIVNVSSLAGLLEQIQNKNGK